MDGTTPMKQTPDAYLDEIVRTVALVARLGEADRRGWWGTHSFGPAGRVVLKNRLSRTWRMAAVELDIAAARNRHDEIIDRPNAIHLFSDNWPVRRWTSAWVAEQKTADPPDAFFAELESTSEDELADWLRKSSAQHALTGSAVRIGTIDRALFADAELLAPSVALLTAVYADMGQFTVPYLEVAG